ncbi:MAG: (2Fe-2S)-binding protein [Cohaesibacteraceae bacterium]|nr:(2Fe-2S)-binding protein [Cohaesibacteraceae bacterium]
MSVPYRIAERVLPDRIGQRINRKKKIRFTFDRKTVPAFQGDTIASALLANGQRIISRSFKLHRPRGILSYGSNDPGSLISVGTGASRTPNTRATMTPVSNGMVSESQNNWPSLKKDWSRYFDRIKRFLPAGFYYKTFMKPMFLVPVYQRVLRLFAGTGTLLNNRDTASYEHYFLNVDVLVIGGGLSGLVVAEAASTSGAKVCLVDENGFLGGLSDIFDGQIENVTCLDWARKCVTRLAENPNVHLLPDTTATGMYDHGFVIACERCSGHSKNNDSVEERLWKIRALHTVLATGAIEQPLLFPNNDIPGIHLSSTIRAMIVRHAVAPGHRGVIYTTNDDGYKTALLMIDAGIEVIKIVDARLHAEGTLVDLVKANGILITFASTILEVITDKSNIHIQSVVTGALQGTSGITTKIDCDFISVSGSWAPVVHLWCNNGGKLEFDANSVCMRPVGTQNCMSIVGSANNVHRIENLLEESWDGGHAAAQHALGKRIRKPTPSFGISKSTKVTTSDTVGQIVRSKTTQEKDFSVFVDIHNDVTIADLKLACREGYASVEHMKRYTSLGMAPDQGKTSNLNAAVILANIQKCPVGEIGTTTYRPPYTPLRLGTIGGSQPEFKTRVFRQLPSIKWHKDNGAVLDNIGGWSRPLYYARQKIKRSIAITSEINAVRNHAGLFDASSLGKIEIKGPDSAKFLDLVYATKIDALPVGRALYGVLLNESGTLLDDGVISRLKTNLFVIYTTSGNSGLVLDHLERWHQTEWPDLRVFITSVTENYAHFSLSGPRTLEILKSLEGFDSNKLEISNYLDVWEDHFSDIDLRVLRVSYSGAYGVELSIPSNHATELWQALMHAGKELSIKPIGVEAMHTLRTEVGYIAMGIDTDTDTIPADVGLDWAVSDSKPDFIGKYGLVQDAHINAPRKKLVGILTKHENSVPEYGAPIFDRPHIEPGNVIGHVTSAFYSPTISRSISLALVSEKHIFEGAVVHISQSTGTTPANIRLSRFITKEQAGASPFRRDAGGQ